MTSNPLIKASSDGDLKRVKTLVEGGAQLDAQDCASGFDYVCCTAITCAANKGQINVVKYLAEHGADINTVDDSSHFPGNTNWTPLHYAAYRGNLELTYFLLGKGADLTATTSNGVTPLGIASSPEVRNVLAAVLQKQYADVRLEQTAGTVPSPSRREPVAKAPEPNEGFYQLAEKVFAAQQTARPLAPASAQPVSPVVTSDVDLIPTAMTRRINNAYAVVVGIEQYRQKLPSADFATHDAKTVADYLTKVLGYPEENVVTLLNDRATNVDFVKYFEKWLPNNVEPGATVFVYYSGHGAPNPRTGDAYLVPYDGDPAFIDETGYSLKRMYAALGKLPAKEVVVAIDSCFSGAGGRSVIAKGTRSISLNLKEQAPLARNMTVLAASSGEQTSSTYDEKGHGLFTYFLLKGIKHEDVIASDGSLRLGDLFAYLQPQVERVARKQYNNEQTPQLIAPHPTP